MTRRVKQLPVRDDDLDADGFEVSKDEWYFGYNFFLAVLVNLVGKPMLPHLATSARTRPANAMGAVAPMLVAMVTAVKRRWESLLDVLIDMGFSMRKPLTWAKPLALLGVFVVFDLPKNRRGVRRKKLTKGQPDWNGEPLCHLRVDSMDELRIARLTDSLESWSQYWKSSDLRLHSMFRRLGHATPDMVQRYECPACARWGRCPLHPPSLDLRPKADIVNIEGTPGKDIFPGPLCGKSVTLHLKDNLGRRQRDPVGTHQHAVSFRRRTAVERYFSYVKDTPHWRRGAIRSLNPAAVHLFLVCICVATNGRQLRRWRSRFGTRLAAFDYRAEAMRLYRERPCPPTHSTHNCPRCISLAAELRLGVK